MDAKLKIKLPSDQDASGRSFGKEELVLLQEVLDSGVLIGTSGTQVKKLEQELAARYGVSQCTVVASGTAACQTAYAALNLEPGDEVICSPITDMGSIATLLYQQLIPVFADVDPVTLNITTETVKDRLSPYTKAIVVTHLFGNPCDIQGIMKLANRYDLPVVEDCAQSFLATVDGQLTGTFGKIGAFSFQQGKHITCGEGGFTITNDEAAGRHMRLFRDKGWGFGDPAPDHYFLGPNYRMTELQAAVARGRLTKLDDNVKRRIASATEMHRLLKDVRGLTLPIPRAGVIHTYWKYLLMVDDRVIKGGADALGAKLKERGIWCVPRYIKKPAFECDVIKLRKTFGTSGYPYHLPSVNNRHDECEKVENFPGVYNGLAHALVLPWNEKYTQEHLVYIAENIKESVKCLL